MHPPARFALLIAALGIATGSQGCSASGDEVPMETFAAQFPRNFCALAYSCCAPEHVVRLFPYGSPSRDAGDCSGHLGQELNRYIEVLQMRLAPITYDGQRAGRCLARLAMMSCADLVATRTQSLEPAWECNEVFKLQGHAPVGAVCGQQYDCAPGLYCEQPGHDTQGVCRPESEHLGACPNAACPTGMYCDSETNGMCVAGAAEGAACRYDGRCARKVCWGANPRLMQDGTCGVPPGTCSLRP